MQITKFSAITGLVALLLATSAPVIAAASATPAGMGQGHTDATAARAPVVAGKFRMDLPGGGVVWATEDPQQGEPVLSVRAPGTAAVSQGRLVEPLPLTLHANHAAFVERVEVVFFAGHDVDMVTPLATVDIPVGHLVRHDWDPAGLAGALPLRSGESLRYIARAYGKQGGYDETTAQELLLVTPAEQGRGTERLREAVSRSLGRQVGADQAVQLQSLDAVYGRSMLRLQNIRVHGSRVRIHGQGLQAGARVRINGLDVPVDQEGRFVAEFIEPVGPHGYAVELETADGWKGDTLHVDVTGRYAFMVALADLTLSDSHAGGSVEPLAGDEGFDDGFLSEGRLAFYLKGKIKGRYLVTAQADTQQRRLSRLFNGFFDAAPEDLFRQLDPEAYYPVYGDDSSTWRDVDSQGQFYVRMDWDGNQALWGNFNTGLTNTALAHYNRSLHGGALDWRSQRSTDQGDAVTTVRGFVSEAQTALGHSAFLGTGGSLYYLRHTAILPGSDKVVLEVRDPKTGRTESSTILQRGADYEIDSLQGRLLLTRPLAQLTRENVSTLTRDTPLDGHEQHLLVDYEYLPDGNGGDDLTLGIRGRHWLNDQVGLGFTWVDENRAGDDYALQGMDLTLRAGKGTSLRIEHARSESTVAPIFHSTNGGLDFEQRNPDAAREGQATHVDARVNLRELGWTRRDWTAGAWWHDMDAGYSVARSDQGLQRREKGVEFQGHVSEDVQLVGRYSAARLGGQSQDQWQLIGQWHVSENQQLSGEVNRLEQRAARLDTDATLLAVRYAYRYSDEIEVSATGQGTLDDDKGRYASNDLVTLGARYLYGDRSNVGLEATAGSRGEGLAVQAEHFLGTDRSIYGGYTFSTDRSERETLFNPTSRNGWTLGQRSRITDRTRVFSETQSLRGGSQEGDGIAHTFGVDFLPAQGWNIGLTVMDSSLESARGTVDRRAYSLSAGRTDPRVQWASKMEYRHDAGAERRNQWVTTNRLAWRLDDDWRLAARANHARTRDRLSRLDDTQLSEVNLGFAWRPHDDTRWAAFGKYTYLYDLGSNGQIGGARTDQRSHVVALEGVHQLDDDWKMAGKVARRWGDYRLGRGVGPWMDSQATLVAVQLRRGVGHQWETLVEARRLSVARGGARKGWLVGMDRRVGENFKVGVGYNFTGFSDDLTELRHDHRGWFLNLAGFY